jgi:hypothetical protein
LITSCICERPLAPPGVYGLLVRRQRNFHHNARRRKFARLPSSQTAAAQHQDQTGMRRVFVTSHMIELTA